MEVESSSFLIPSDTDCSTTQSYTVMGDARVTRTVMGIEEIVGGNFSPNDWRMTTNVDRRPDHIFVKVVCTLKFPLDNKSQ